MNADDSCASRLPQPLAPNLLPAAHLAKHFPTITLKTPRRNSGPIQLQPLPNPPFARERPQSSPPLRRRSAELEPSATARPSVAKFHFLSSAPTPPPAEEGEGPLNSYYQSIEKAVEQAFSQRSIPQAGQALAAIDVAALCPATTDSQSGETSDGAAARKADRKPRRRRARSVETIDANNSSNNNNNNNSSSSPAASPAAAPLQYPAGRRASVPAATAESLAVRLERMSVALQPSAAAAASQRLVESGDGQAKLREEVASHMKRIVDVFREIDADGSGEVDRQEFRRGLRQILCGDYADDELDELFRSVDASHDGTISYRELARTLRAPASTKAAPTFAQPSPPAAAPPPRPRRASHGGSRGRTSPSSSPPPAEAAVAAATTTTAEPPKKAVAAKGWDVVRKIAASASSSSNAAANGCYGGVSIHPLRQREVLTLYQDFKSQHADGVCQVDRFDKLLRLHYPTESRGHIAAMVAHVVAEEAAEERAASERAERRRAIAEVFEALDLDGRGTIGLNEFLALEKTAGLGVNRADLKAIFRKYDDDGSGALDNDEFYELVEGTGLMAHKDAIVEGSKELQQAKEEQRTSKAALWQLGLPRQKKEANKPSNERPSLVNVSNQMLNMRRAIQATA